MQAPGCNLAFYPTYGLVGRYVGKVTRLPIDVAMLAVSLVASFLFLFLWTGRELTSRLGVGTTYLALICFNAYTTGYCLTTVQTEPLTLALALGAYVAFARRRRLARARCWPGPPAAFASPGWRSGSPSPPGCSSSFCASGRAGPGPGSAPRCWRSSASGGSWC